MPTKLLLERLSVFKSIENFLPKEALSQSAKKTTPCRCLLRGTLGAILQASAGSPKIILTYLPTYLLLLGRLA